MHTSTALQKIRRTNVKDSKKLRTADVTDESLPGLQKCLDNPDLIPNKNELEIFKLFALKILECNVVLGKIYRNYPTGKTLEIGTAVSGGYYQLKLSYNGKTLFARVNRIIAQLCFGPCPEGFVVHHRDHNKLNNSIDNLAFATDSENSKESSSREHIKDIMRVKRSGVNSPTSKLTTATKNKAFKLKETGTYTNRKIANILNVSDAAISMLFSGKTHKHDVKKVQNSAAIIPKPIIPVADLDKLEGEAIERDRWLLSLVISGELRVTRTGKIYRVSSGNWLGSVGRTGYVQISLRDKDSGKPYTFKAHRLIYLCFKGIIPEGKVIDHIDDNKSNNHIDNLQLLTSKENTQKAHDTGCFDKAKASMRNMGENNSRSVLTDAILDEARLMIASGTSVSATGRILGVNRATLQDAICGKSWRHREKDPSIVFKRPKVVHEEDKVILIRYEYRTQKVSYSELGRRHDMHPVTIRRICIREIHKCVLEVAANVCSKCGTRKENLSYYDKEWTCDCCKTLHNRQENIDKNEAYFEGYRKALKRLPSPDEYLRLRKKDYASNRRVYKNNKLQPMCGKIKGLRRFVPSSLLVKYNHLKTRTKSS